MKTFSKTALLHELSGQTEILLNKAVQQWQMMPPARFSGQPASGSWSATQCLSHLNGYGDYYLPLLCDAVKRRPAKAEANVFTSGWLGDYFTKLMQPEPGGGVAKKMKAFKQHLPAAHEDSDAVIARFIEQQETLLILLQEAGSADLNLRVVPISIARFIRLKTGDVFRFLIAHNLRHVAQAERALHAAKVNTELKRA